MKGGRWLYILRRYLLFFALVAFVISCSIMLFMTTITSVTGIEFTEEYIKEAAIATALNILLLSALLTVIDAVRRYFMVTRPVRRIVRAAEQMASGDFSVRVPEMYAVDGFDEIARCFNTLARELAGTETLRSDFIASVSHELKTPLAVIQNYGSMLQQPGLTGEERMEYAKSVTDAARRLTSLVTNILRLNKLENQQIYPDAAEYDLGEQLSECLLGFEDAWEAKELDISAEMAEGVTVKADAELLSLVWNNLFSNAIKFTEPGGRVSVSLSADGPDAVVTVADTGCGISPEVGRHIFEKFYQGDTSHATEGNGLGLALVRRVIDIAGGEISVSSEVDAGSEFTVRLRRCPGGEAEKNTR